MSTLERVYHQFTIALGKSRQSQQFHGASTSATVGESYVEDWKRAFTSKSENKPPKFWQDSPLPYQCSRTVLGESYVI